MKLLLLAVVLLTGCASRLSAVKLGADATPAGDYGGTVELDFAAK